MPKEQTVLEQVRQMLVDKVHPDAILSWIDSTGIPAERKMVEDAWDESTAATGSDDTGSQYFDNRFGKE